MHKDKSEQIIQFDQFGGVTRKMLTCFPVAHITMNRASYKNNGTNRMFEFITLSPLLYLGP